MPRTPRFLERSELRAHPIGEHGVRHVRVGLVSRDAVGDAAKLSGQVAGASFDGVAQRLRTGHHSSIASHAAW